MYYFPRLLVLQMRISRYRAATVAILASVAAGAALGGPPAYRAITGNGGSSSPGTANLWIDTTGGSCTRLTTAGSYSDSAACSSMQVAITACVAGDTIRMRTGTYAAQTITTSKSSPCFIIGGDGGTTTIGNLQTNANFIDISDINGSSWNDEDIGNHDVTLRNMNFVGSIFIDGGTNISMIGGSQSGAFSGGSPSAVQVQGSPGTATNIVFNGVAIHDNTCRDSGNVNCVNDHYEAIRFQDNVASATVKNSYFYNNKVDSAVIFISNTSGGNPSNLTFENNFIEGPQAPPGHAAAFVDIDANIPSCSNWTFSYNTFYDSPAGTFNNCTKTNVVWRANIGPRPNACPGNTFDKNLWVGGTCGGTDSATGDLGLTGDGFHLSGSSPARAAGSVTCPSTDHDGQTRPQPAATTCDAGADEVP